ncbi:MAG: hypothetical protein HY203_05470 [Nitrospirae bacterium]|nr:hypothetical protein [Nitrospirota bacterium]
MKNMPMQNRKWLSLGWKVMVALGIVNIFFAVMVPLVSLFMAPLFVFGSEDATFVGKSWNEIVAFSPDLGFWIVLTMVSMCAMMMGWGVLTVGVAKNAYQRGERWAWRTLVWTNVLTMLYYAIILMPFASRGLWGVSAAFPSGVSLGLPMLVFFTIWPIIGLWLPRKELIE